MRATAKQNRVAVALSCTVCGGRNYKTTRSRGTSGLLRLSKFCKHCNQHTEHVESK